VTQLKQLYDYKKWVKPHIDTPHEHTNPHNFLFRLNSKKEAIMLYRNWSSDSWISGPEGEGLKLLKVHDDANSKLITLIMSFNF
jgi:hypothetical protein